MSKKKVQKLLALMLGAAMVLSVAACGAAEGTGTESSDAAQAAKKEEPAKEESAKEENAAEEEELVTLSFYSDTAVSDSAESQWVWDYFAENLNLAFDVRMATGDDQVMAALLAGGELPDVVVFYDQQDLTAAVNGGMLLNLSEYQEQLPSLYADDFYTNALKKMDYLFGGHYVVPAYTGSESDPQELSNASWNVRWDLYKELGYPAVPDEDAWLDVVAQMLEMEPENADGLKNYGFGLWTDWDVNSNFMSTFHYLWPYGYDTEYTQGLIEVKADGDISSAKSILDDDSMYKRSLKFFFKANQLGLIDPDSMAMDYSAFAQKADAGQYIVNFNWGHHRGITNQEDFTGWVTLYPDDASPMTMGGSSAGGSYWIGLSSKCSNVDKALEFINFWFSEEGRKIVHRGPEGAAWEMKDGKAVYTEAYLEAYKNNEPYYVWGDEANGQPGDMAVFVNCLPANETALDDNGQPYKLSRMDELTLQSLKVNYMRDDWQNLYGKEYATIDAYYEDKLETVLLSPAYSTFTPPASDDMVMMANQIGSIVKENSWKMIFADDEAEFEALWAQTQADGDALGIDIVVEDYKNRLQEGLDVYNSFMN